MRTHDFRQSIEVGKQGEILIMEYLENNENVLNVEDVSDNPTYQDSDIDFIVQFANGKTGTIEIKTDRYTSGNIFYETISNKEHGVPGCMVKSKADFLFYYFTETRELYIINFNQYRKWFDENINRFNRKELKNIDRKRTGTYTSVGYTIPKIYLEANFKGYKKEII